jgi:carotenoid 1,2-hydratase
MNVALYGPRGSRWAMTERGRSALRRTHSALSIGPSDLVWDGDGLTATIDEVTAPLPSRLRGTIRLHPSAIFDEAFPLDAAGRHAWRPIAPRARVEVSLTHPGQSWCGNGYFDTNAGSEPLQEAFATWNWSRAHMRGDTQIFYDVVRRDGRSHELALRFGADGDRRAIEAPPSFQLAPTFWRMPRAARSDPGDPPTVRRTMEDAPFYTRSLLDTRHDGEAAEVVHESLSLDRLRSPVVRAMLPFRMPRVFW